MRLARRSTAIRHLNPIKNHNQNNLEDFMSHSRSKGQRQQQQRHQEPSQEWNQARTDESRYGESQGMYGGQGGYRAINYTDRFGNPGGESEYQGSRQNRDNPRYGQQQQDWRSDWRSQE